MALTKTQKEKIKTIIDMATLYYFGILLTYLFKEQLTWVTLLFIIPPILTLAVYIKYKQIKRQGEKCN